MILPERLENGILRDSVFRSLKGRMSVRMRRTMIPPVSCGGIVQRAVSQIEITLFRINIDFQNFFTEICFRNSSKKKKTAIAFSGYVFYICIDILEPRKV